MALLSANRDSGFEKEFECAQYTDEMALDIYLALSNYDAMAETVCQKLGEQEIDAMCLGLRYRWFLEVINWFCAGVAFFVEENEYNIPLALLE